MRHWLPVLPGSRTTVASNRRTWRPPSRGCKSTPLSFQSCWHNSRSQPSASRKRFNNVTSETLAMPANLACTAVSRSDQPQPTCSSSVRSNASNDGNPRKRVTAPQLLPNRCHSAGNRPSKICQSSRAHMRKAQIPPPDKVNPYLSAYAPPSPLFLQEYDSIGVKV